MKKRWTWEEKWNALKHLEDMLVKLGFKKYVDFAIDCPEHMSHIYCFKTGWHSEYPEVEELMDKYNLYNNVDIRLQDEQ
jgi:hypothetical protein